jgi:protein phosphatase methylesterase 1
VPWTQYFSQNIHVPSSTSQSLVFNVYYSPPTVPNAPVYVFHHGAGSSALSFSLVAQHLVSAISCGVLAFDVRHHGATVINELEEYDLSLETLAQDEIDVVEGVARHAKWEAEHWPDLILVGHRYHQQLDRHQFNPSNSLGGAVSAHIAANNLVRALCLCVIDVVEGSAMDALKSMQTYLSTRPKTFDSLEAGIRWHLQSQTLRNRASARVSVPPLLVQDAGHWSWRTDLAKTRPFWEGSPFMSCAMD